MRVWTKWLAAGTLAAAVAGCGGGGGDEIEEPSRPLRLRTLELSVGAGVNSNRPVEITLVRVLDAKHLDKLLAIETPAWYDGEREVFEGAAPDSIIQSWEVVPGTRVGPEDMEVDDKVAGVLYCNLIENPQPPTRVERNGQVVVSITDEGCEIGGGTPTREPTDIEKALGAVGEKVGGVFEGISEVLGGGN